MSIGQKLHLADGRVADERLGEVWEAVYEGYSERWSDDDVQRSIDVGEEVCSALEELVELRAKLARVEALPAEWRGRKPRGTGTMTTGEVAVVQYAFQDAATDLEAALSDAIANNIENAS